MIEEIHDDKTPLFVDLTLRPYVDLLKVHASDGAGEGSMKEVGGRQ